jgi:hypothetical protein
MCLCRFALVSRRAWGHTNSSSSLTTASIPSFSFISASSSHWNFTVLHYAICAWLLIQCSRSETFYLLLWAAINCYSGLNVTGGEIQTEEQRYEEIIKRNTYRMQDALVPRSPWAESRNSSLCTFLFGARMMQSDFPWTLRNQNEILAKFPYFETRSSRKN